MAESDPILILEDDVLIAMEIEATLAEAGYGRLVLCHNVKQARAFLAQSTPAFAFLDINLGRGDTSFEIGIELAARDCPIVFLSGYSPETVEIPPEIETAPRLTKPFITKDLLKVAERLSKGT